jgi:hypothetical protein
MVFEKQQTISLLFDYSLYTSSRYFVITISFIDIKNEDQIHWARLLLGYNFERMRR